MVIETSIGNDHDSVGVATDDESPCRHSDEAIDGGHQIVDDHHHGDHDHRLDDRDHRGDHHHDDHLLHVAVQQIRPSKQIDPTCPH